MSSLIEQLNDIEGIDLVSFWPLSLASWLVILFGMLMLGSVIWLLKRRLDYLRSWKRDTFKKLDSLEQNLSPSMAKETIAFLSEYLRRIVVRRFPRKECAGLVGDAWLNWLKTHDPKQFDWTQKGKILVEIPYTPDHTNLPVEQVKELIQAVRHWVH